ncbi:MAG: LamG-like jellyroll fold domain-containing protein [Synergistaceae bacterium]
MSNYASLAVRQYGEGRICIITDRVSGHKTYHGASPVSFWRNLLEWTGQRFDNEDINIALIDNASYMPMSALSGLHQIRITKLSFQDIAIRDLSIFDVIYISGLPELVSNDVHEKIEPYVANGGGLFIESPDRGGENINVLTSIDDIYCQSVDKPLQENSYWTVNGKSHYTYYSGAFIEFLSAIELTSFSSDWTVLMSSIPTTTVAEGSTATIITDSRIGSEFGLSYIASMQKGIALVNEETLVSSSSSSLDSSSSSSSSSFEDPDYWDFCDDIVAYWKMNDNINSPIIWDESGDFRQIGRLYSGTGTISTSTKSRTGIINRAINFDGVNDYVVTYDNTSLNFINSGVDTPCTISFWIYPEDADLGGSYILYKDETWGVYIQDSRIIFEAYDGTAIRYASTITKPVRSLEWNHIVITYDGTVSGFAFYYNGKSVQKTSFDIGSYVGMDNKYSTMYMATRKEQYYYGGTIDNILILNRNINSIEVEGLFNRGKATEDCEGVCLYTSSSSSYSSLSSESSSSSVDSSSSTSLSSSSTSSSSSSSSSQSTPSSMSESTVSSGGESESSSSYRLTSESSSYGQTSSSSTSSSSGGESSSSSFGESSSSSSKDSSSSSSYIIPPTTTTTTIAPARCSTPLTICSGALCAYTSSWDIVNWTYRHWFYNCYAFVNYSQIDANSDLITLSGANSWPTIHIPVYAPAIPGTFFVSPNSYGISGSVYVSSRAPHNTTCTLIS